MNKAFPVIKYPQGTIVGYVKAEIRKREDGMRSRRYMAMDHERRLRGMFKSRLEAEDYILNRPSY